MSLVCSNVPVSYKFTQNMLFCSYRHSAQNSGFDIKCSNPLVSSKIIYTMSQNMSFNYDSSLVTIALSSLPGSSHHVEESCIVSS